MGEIFMRSVKLLKLGCCYLVSSVLLTAALLIIAANFVSNLTVEELTQLQLSILVFSAAATVYLLLRPAPVYLVDFACFKPADTHKCSKAEFMERLTATGSFDESTLEFQRKIIDRSGLGEGTYVPESLMKIPPNPCIREARHEAETVMFGALDELFAKTKVKAKDIGVLIVNCCVFSPTPSLSAMIVNRYKLRGNICSFNLSGMGCSAGVIAIDLARDLLQVHHSTYAILVSTENITLNWYLGTDKSMLMSNCLFRMNASAVLLSNKWTDKSRSKYELLNAVRTHCGAEDKSYGCVFQRDDCSGRTGISLSKELMAVAGDALKTHMKTLGPLVLPLTEQLWFLLILMLRKMRLLHGRPYVPDFKKAFEHFCIHAGGKAVLDEMQKRLELTDWHMEPSKKTLHRWGNISSSSVWYELAYCEENRRIKSGDRVWQLGFGSGFKCASAVWRAS